MCVITLVPLNVEVPAEWIENGAGNNPDGHGWAVASEEHGLVVGKSMDPKIAVKDFLAEVERQGLNSVKLFHSRIGTHGTMNLDNVHPFFVPDVDHEGHDHSTVMAHNGIMPAWWHPELSDPRSDTRVFVDQTAKWYLQAAGVPSRRGSKVLANLVGGGNKLVFVSTRAEGRPRVRIINSTAGVWDKGVWFSNTSYKRKPWRRTPVTSYATPPHQCQSDGCKTMVYGTYYDHCYQHRTSDNRPGYVSPYGSSGDPYSDGWEWQVGVKQDDGTWTQSRWVRRDEEIETVVTNTTEYLDEETTSLLDDIEATVQAEVTVSDVDPERKCEVCQVTGAVHIPTNLCLNCKWCLDCWAHMDLCECFDYATWMASRDLEADELAEALKREVEQEQDTEMWLASRAEETMSVPVVTGRSPEELARDAEVCRFFGIVVPDGEEPPVFGDSVYEAAAKEENVVPLTKPKRGPAR